MTKPLLATLIAVAAIGAAQAAETGDIVLRVGAAQVEPREEPEVPTLGVSNGETVAASVAYHFSPLLALEVLGALPFSHDITLGGAKLAEVKQLPPTVTLTLHPISTGPVQPYVGVGFNYTIFFNEQSKAHALGINSIELEDSWGGAVQLGVDAPLNDKWLLNAAAYYIDIDTAAKLNGDPTDKVKVKIDPWAYRVGLGYRF